jgi:hypothetical protein
METFTRNVSDIDIHDRQALEHVLGQTLRPNQQLVIRIVDLQIRPDTQTTAGLRDREGGAMLPEWCNVYAGMSDEEIADLEKTILTRADLSRPSE